MDVTGSSPWRSADTRLYKVRLDFLTISFTVTSSDTEDRRNLICIVSVMTGISFPYVVHFWLSVGTSLDLFPPRTVMTTLLTGWRRYYSIRLKSSLVPTRVWSDAGSSVTAVRSSAAVGAVQSISPTVLPFPFSKSLLSCGLNYILYMSVPRIPACLTPWSISNLSDVCPIQRTVVWASECRL